VNPDVRIARSFLFVPGDRPDRFAKAATSGADAVVLDLEDAVGTDDKARAREHVRHWLEQGNQAVVRINGSGTPHYDADVDMVAEHADTVMLPKAEHAGHVTTLAAALPATTGIIPLLETATGIVQAVDVCRASTVLRPAFGSVDLATQLGIDHRCSDALYQARSSIVLAAASAERGAPIEGVTTTIDDPAALRADTERVKSLGFTAKLCIHPRQVATVNETFLPSATETEWARRVLDAAHDGAAAAVDGQMVDRPVLLRAEAIIART